MMGQHIDTRRMVFLARLVTREELRAAMGQHIDTRPAVRQRLFPARLPDSSSVPSAATFSRQLSSTPSIRVTPRLALPVTPSAGGASCVWRRNVLWPGTLDLIASRRVTRRLPFLPVGRFPVQSAGNLSARNVSYALTTSPNSHRTLQRLARPSGIAAASSATTTTPPRTSCASTTAPATVPPVEDASPTPLRSPSSAPLALCAPTPVNPGMRSFWTSRASGMSLLWSGRAMSTAS